MGSFKENVGMFFTELMQDSIKNLKESDQSMQMLADVFMTYFKTLVQRAKNLQKVF